MDVGGAGVTHSDGYLTPVVRDYGDLIELTANDLLSGGVHSLPLAQVSTPGFPNGSNGHSPSPETQFAPHHGTGGGDATAASVNPGHHPTGGGTHHNPGSEVSPAVQGSDKPDSNVSPAVASGGHHSGGGGGSHLPFTGFQVGIAALGGSIMSAAGVALRRVAKRRSG